MPSIDRLDDPTVARPPGPTVPVPLPAGGGGVPAVDAAPVLDTFTLSHRPRPFMPGREVMTFSVGATLAQIAEAAQPNPRLRDRWTILLDGRPVRRWRTVVNARGEAVRLDDWRRIRPKAGTVVQAAMVPGSGRTALLVVLTIAVLVLAVVAPYAAAALGATWLAAGTVGGALLAATITTAGMLAVNALIPPVQPDLAGAKGQSSPSYGLEGARNGARIHRPIARVLGRHKVVPALGAQSYTEISGDDVYLRMLVVWGYGPLLVEDLRIGDTPLADFDGVEHEFFEGAPGVVNAHALFPGGQATEAFAVDLTEAAGWVSRATAADADEAWIEVTFPEGLEKYGKKSGDRLGQTVEIEVEAAPAGTGAWVSWGAWEVSDKTSSRLVRTYRLLFDARGRYDVRLRRLTGDADSTEARNRSQFTGLRSQRNENPIRQKGLCTSAFRFKASGRLDRTVDEISGIATSIVPDWDAPTGAWVARPTRNPASLHRWLLQGNGTRRPLPDAKVDLPRHEYFHGFCAAKGFACDLILDGDMSLWDARRMVLACGRGAPGRNGVRRSVVIDEPRPAGPVQLFTPRNSSGFKGRRVFVDYPHALRVRFVDNTNGYVTDEYVVYADGYDATNATKFEEWEIPGVTDPGMIYVHAKYHIACSRLRCETYERNLDWEHLSCERGDLVAEAHDVPLWGSGWGRLKAVELGGGGAVAALSADERVEMEAGFDHRLRVRRADNTQAVWDLVTVAGESSRWEVAGLASDTDPGAPGRPPAPGDLCALYRGEPVLTLVSGVRPRGELGAEVATIPYAPAVFTADTLPIPPWTPNVTRPAGADAPRIAAVRSDEAVLQRDADGSAHLQVVVSLAGEGSRPLTRIAGVEVRWRPAGTGAPWRYAVGPAEAAEIVLPGVEAGLTYDVEARWRLAGDRSGRWSSTASHAVADPDLPPPDVASIFPSAGRLEWTPVAAPDLAGYRLRYAAAAGSTWVAALPVSDGLHTLNGVALQEIPTDAVEVLVKAETAGGRESANPARCSVAGLERPRYYRAFVRDLAAEGFPGTVEGAEVAGGALRALDTSLWAWPPDGPWAWPPDGLWASPSWSGFTWDFEYACPQDVRGSDRLALELESEGEVTRLWRSADDRLVFGDDEDPVDGEAEDLDPEWLPLNAGLGGDGGSDYRGWSDGLRPVPGAVIRFRVVGRGGTAARPVVLAARVVVEAAPVTAAAGDLALAVGGTRMPVPAGLFRRIEWVHATLVGPGPAYRPAVLDKSPTAGPRIAAYDRDDVPVSATVDATAGGY